MRVWGGVNFELLKETKHVPGQKRLAKLKSILDTDDSGPNTPRTHVPPPERYFTVIRLKIWDKLFVIRNLC